MDYLIIKLLTILVIFLSVFVKRMLLQSITEKQK